MTRSRIAFLLVTGLLAGGLACAPAPEPDEASDAASATGCDPDNGGLVLADGLCATVFAEGLGAPRHLAVDAEGDVYVQRIGTGRGRAVENPGGVIALRDTDGDGRADVQEDVSATRGTGLALHDGYLWFSSDTEVFRVPLAAGELVPSAAPESIVAGFPAQSQHASKTFAFDDAGGLYVNVGAPSNACQSEMRTAGSPGLDPCPQLEWQSGIWRFDAATPGQTQADGERFSTGIRNAVALDWDPRSGALWAMQHGRDSLSQLWPDLFDHEASAELPSEELFRVTAGSDFGWPYCYHDPVQGAKVLAPEYGGDGTEVGRCADVDATAVAFPAHWAPNDMLFYSGAGLGDGYDGGAFIAFHGSWNRMPLPQGGYNVVFVPFAEGAPAGDWEVVIDGFAGTDEIRMPGDAAHRPTGLAQGPDGALYVADDAGGRIYRIVRAPAAADAAS